MADLSKIIFRNIIDGLNLVVARSQLLNRNCKHLHVAAAFVFHQEHAERTAADHGSGQQRERSNHANVNGVTVIAEGLRDETVVCRITHGSADETVDQKSAAFFVYFVLDGVALCGDFNHNIEIVRQVFSCADFAHIHNIFPTFIN